MADELIDILNDDFSFLKTDLKSEAHKHGWLHPCIHVWFFTDDGQLLVQKRSPDKQTFPNLWDVSVAGHIGNGENKIDAAIREVEEEIGLKINSEDLEFIGTFSECHTHRPNFTDNEIHYIYLSKLSVTIDQLKIQKEELSAIKLIPIDSFKNVLEKTDFDKTYVPHYDDYYHFILREISGRI